MTNKVSDNLNPKLILVEGSAPSTPAAGNQVLYIDNSDHKVKRKDSSGTVVIVEGSGSGLVIGVTMVDLSSDQSTLNATTKWTDFPGSMSATITPASSSSRFVVTLTGSILCPTSNSLFLAIKCGSLTAVTVAAAQQTAVEVPISGSYVFSPATSSSIAIKTQYYVSGGTGMCRPASFRDNERLTMIITELSS